MKTVSTLLLLALAGCATSPSPQELALRQEIAASTPTCREAKECEVKWSAARQWVTKNAGWKLQHITPDFMETYNSVNASVALAARVEKTPQADGSYRIVATVWCDNWIGCQPDKLAALLDFNRSVTAAWAPAPTNR